VKIIERVKTYAFRHFFGEELNRRHVSRSRLMINLPQANFVGVLFEFNNEDEYNTISTFMKSLQDEGKRIRSVGYFNGKKMPHYFMQKLSSDLIIPKQVNWYGKPTSDFIEGFLQEEFDVLIDFSRRNILPLQYIAGLSSANLKTGLYGRNNAIYYDIMLHTSPEVPLDEYINQIKHYLTLLNN
jgi:hypothetical protein